MKPNPSDSASERGSKIMSKFASLIILAISFPISALGLSEARAQALPEARIAIVDYQLIRKNSTAMVDIRSQIE